MLVAAPAAAAMAAGGQVPRPFESSQVHMGLPVRILLHAPDAGRAQSATAAAFARIAALDRMMSDYRPDSELRRLEAGGTAWTPVSPDLLEVLTTAVTIARATDGAFDPTVGPLVQLWRASRKSGKLPAPDALEAARALVGWRHLEIDRGRGAIRLAKPGMRLDLGGIAKGYILQQALRTLRQAGLGRALIDTGGDIIVGSGPPGLAGWRIDAADADAVFRQRASQLTNAALATSGDESQFVEIDGVRYSHIVDPRTGLGLTHQVTARVIARDGAIADALATALAVMGPEGVAPIKAKFPDVLISLSVPAAR
jgi:FAD:protein FMN transferase